MILDISDSAFKNILNDDQLFLPIRWNGVDFSETLEKHNAAVKTFQMNPKAREGKSWKDLNQPKPNK